MTSTDIIIPTHNQHEFTLQCLAAIDKHTSDYRIIWIDNGSEDKSIAIVTQVLKNLPHVKLLNQKNTGFIQAVNQGLKLASGEFVVILNNDTIVTQGWLDKMRRVFLEVPEAGLVGPLTSTEGSWQGVNRLRADPRFSEDFQDLPTFEVNDTPDSMAKKLELCCAGQRVEIRGMLAFFCVLIRRTIIEEVGPLSQEYGVGFCDDDDYCIRVRSAGYRLFVAKDAFVFHHHRTTFRTLYGDEEINKMIRENKALFKDKWKVDRMPFYKDPSQDAAR